MRAAALASGLASRIRARRSVYFHSSTRLLGKPSLSKRRNAFWRRAATAAVPGNERFAASKCAASADSAEVLIGRISAFMKTSRRLVVILRVAGFFELQRQFLAAGFYNAPARENVDNIRHDVIKQALIMGNDHERALRIAQPVYAIRHDLEGIDVESRIGFVQHAKPRLEQSHLQDFIALFFAAGEADIDGSAQHFLVNCKLACHFTHALEEFGRQNLRLAALLALGI